MITAALFLIALLAYITKAITGFGNTLVMASLFSFFVSNRLTTPVDLLFSIPTNAYMAWRERRNIKLPVVLPTAALLLAGAIPGALLLKSGNDNILKAFLGIVVMGIGIEMLTRRPSSNKKGSNSTILLTAVGLTSGVLAGMFGIGAPLVAYINRTTSNHSEFRANLCCVFLVDNLFRLFYYIALGLISMEIIKYSLILSPAALLGMFTGIKLDGRLGEKVTKQIVVILLIISGLTLFINNIFFALKG